MKNNTLEAIVQNKIPHPIVFNSIQIPHDPTSTHTQLRSNPTSIRIRSAQLSSGEFCATGAFKPLEGLSQGGLMAHWGPYGRTWADPTASDYTARCKAPKGTPNKRAQGCHQHQKMRQASPRNVFHFHAVIMHQFLYGMT